MTDFQIGLLGFPVLLTLILLRIPLAVALLVVGLAGKVLIEGQANGANSLLKQQMFNDFNTYSLSLIPLFLLMSEFATKGGMSQALFKAAEAFVGRRKGGLALSAILGSGAFGAICGSSLATATTMGRVALPELQRAGYSGALATGTLAAGGTLGILIPPSIVLVIYGILAEANIERLFAAALVPGLLAIAGYMAVIAFVVRSEKNPPARAKKPWFEDQIWQGPRCAVMLLWGLICGALAFTGLGYAKASILLLAGLLTLMIFVPIRENKGFKIHVRAERIKRLTQALPALLIFAAVVGGIYGGVFSPTAAAGIGAGLTLLLALIRSLRSDERNLGWIGTALINTAKTSAMILFIVVAAKVFNAFLASATVPQTIAEIFIGSNLSPWMILIGMVLLYLALGTIMDSLAMIFLTVPIFVPIILQLDFGIPEDQALLWFGILVLVSAEVGLITPPIGLNLFVINALANKVPMGQTYRGVLPFVVSDMVRIALLVAFPWITLALVRLIY